MKGDNTGKADNKGDAGVNLSRIIIPRGFLKAHILYALSMGEAHGYEIRQRIFRETGFWRPSFGTLYPLLRKMREEGLIEVREEGPRRKVYALTAKGMELAEKIARVRDELRDKVYQMLSLSTGMNADEIRYIFESMSREEMPSREKCERILDLLHSIVKNVMLALSGTDTDIDEIETVLRTAEEKIRSVRSKKAGSKRVGGAGK